jgi:hypothetical protein
MEGSLSFSAPAAQVPIDFIGGFVELGDSVELDNLAEFGHQKAK